MLLSSAVHFGTACKGLTILLISYKSIDSSRIAYFHRLNAPFRPLSVFAQKSMRCVFVAQSNIFTSVVCDHHKRPPRERSTSHTPVPFDHDVKTLTCSGPLAGLKLVIDEAVSLHQSKRIFGCRRARLEFSVICVCKMSRLRCSAAMVPHGLFAWKPPKNVSKVLHCKKKKHR